MSERTLDADLKAGAQSSEFGYVIFVSLAFPSGTIYTHNSIGTYSFGGNDYLGVGGFGGISGLDETMDLVDQPIKLMLSSVDVDILNAISTEDIYGRDVNIYIGSIDQNGILAGTPTLWSDGYMDMASISIGDENSVSVKVQTTSARLNRKNNKRWTIEDHQRDHPGDRFFSLLPEMDLAQPRWGGDPVPLGERPWSNLGSSPVNPYEENAGI